jgi:hypothetical protein
MVCSVSHCITLLREGEKLFPLGTGQVLLYISTTLWSQEQMGPIILVVLA